MGHWLQIKLITDKSVYLEYFILHLLHNYHTRPTATLKQPNTQRPKSLRTDNKTLPPKHPDNIIKDYPLLPTTYIKALPIHYIPIRQYRIFLLSLNFCLEFLKTASLYSFHYQYVRCLGFYPPLPLTFLAIPWILNGEEWILLVWWWW